jgi:hypothetical protein
MGDPWRGGRALSPRGLAASNPAGRGYDPRMDNPPTDIDRDIEAAVLRRLLDHLNERSDVQNIDLMILAGFCRNCLADWYLEAAAERGVQLDRDAARERIYGEPFADWKSKYQQPATAAQLAAFEAARKAHDS